MVLFEEKFLYSVLNYKFIEEISCLKQTRQNKHFQMFKENFFNAKKFLI